MRIAVIRNSATPALAALIALAAPAEAPAQDLTAGTKARGAVYSEDARDLGAPAPGVAPASERSASYLDLGPFVHVQFGDSGGFLVRTQLFAAAGDEVVQNEDERPVASDRYAAVRELWLEYGGITSFPGEVLRLGLQRVKEPDGLWWDRDIESLRWIFDTTLVQAQLGVAEQFDTWRSDDVGLSPSQEKRAYAFASASRQWRPGFFHGLRIAYAHDHGRLPETGDTVDASTKTQERRYLWVALRSDNGFYDPRAPMPVQFWAEAIALGGQRESAQTDPLSPTPDQVTGHSRTEVAALAGDLGLRARLPLIFPLSIGGMASRAQGGGGDPSHVFVQTGLESNRSRFTGTRTLINRFNEALAADWSNLRALSAFASMPGERADLSIVHHRFERDDGRSGFSADGIDAQPVNDSTDLGRGWDVVATWFFRSVAAQQWADDEDDRSSLRLRASRFEPGAAFGDAVKDQVRVTLEATLWF